MIYHDFIMYACSCFQLLESQFCIQLNESQNVIYEFCPNIATCHTTSDSVSYTMVLFGPRFCFSHFIVFLVLAYFLHIYYLNYWSLLGTSSTKDAGNIPVFPLHCPSNQSWLTKTKDEMMNQNHISLTNHNILNI